MSHQNQSDFDHITIIVGPPSTDKLKSNIRRWSANSRKPQDKIWAELIEATVNNNIENDTEYEPSTVNEAFSYLLMREINVSKPFHTYRYRGDYSDPVIMFYTKHIYCSSGLPVSIDEFTEDVRILLSEFFGGMLKCEWIHVSSSYRLE